MHSMLLLDEGLANPYIQPPCGGVAQLVRAAES